MQIIELPTDSGDYHFLELGAKLAAIVPGMTCEIGLRRGGGTKVIIDVSAAHCPGKVHIAIDPYGHIPYEHKEGEVVKLDYTNDMRDECLSNLYAYTRLQRVPFIFFNLEDTEFFQRYADGVPVYSDEKRLETHYSLVHLDGPHAVDPLLKEIDFFLPRTTPGGVWVFDDVKGYYDHDHIEEVIFQYGFKLVEKGHHKAVYQYKP